MHVSAVLKQERPRLFLRWVIEGALPNLDTGMISRPREQKPIGSVEILWVFSLTSCPGSLKSKRGRAVADVLPGRTYSSVSALPGAKDIHPGGPRPCALCLFSVSAAPFLGAAPPVTSLRARSPSSSKEVCVEKRQINSTC